MKAILRFQLPATLGSDLAGVVIEVGSRVTRFKPGDAVFASIFGLRTGALAYKWIRILFRCWQERTPYDEL